MSRVDRLFADARYRALRHPWTRARTLDNYLTLPGGVSIGLSVNK